MKQLDCVALSTMGRFYKESWSLTDFLRRYRALAVSLAGSGAGWEHLLNDDGANNNNRIQDEEVREEREEEEENDGQDQRSSDEGDDEGDDESTEGEEEPRGTSTEVEGREDEEEEEQAWTPGAPSLTAEEEILPLFLAMTLPRSEFYVGYDRVSAIGVRTKGTIRGGHAGGCSVTAVDVLILTSVLHPFLDPLVTAPQT